MSRRMANRRAPLPPDAELFAAASTLFEYRADGFLVFKVDPRRKNCLTSKVIGKRVGGDDGHGYLSCLLLGQKFKVHQIVWLLHHGVFPKSPIDHANRNRKDNRIENLRLASDLENQQNLISATKPSAGTWMSPRSGRYAARLTYNGVKSYLGYFDTREEANAAYRAEKRRLSARFSPV